MVVWEGTWGVPGVPTKKAIFDTKTANVSHRLSTKESNLETLKTIFDTKKAIFDTKLANVSHRLGVPRGNNISRQKKQLST